MTKKVLNSGFGLKTAFGILTQQRMTSIDPNKVSLQKVSALWLGFASISSWFSFTFIFLAAAKLLDDSYCLPSLGCTVLTEVHTYFHKPLIVADIHHSGTGHVLLHRATSLLPVYNEERKNFASPFNPLSIKTTGQLVHCLHTDPLLWSCSWGCPQQIPQQSTLTSIPASTPTLNLNTSDFRQVDKLISKVNSQEKSGWRTGAHIACFILDHSPFPELLTEKTLWSLCRRPSQLFFL